MSWYSTGSVTITAGAGSVIGTGTAFLNNARNGDAFLGPDGKWYEIINVISDTSMTISPGYLSSSVSLQPYKIVPVQGYVKSSADTLNQITADLVDRLDAIDNLDQYELSYLNGVTSNIQAQLDSKFTGNPAYIANRANHTGVQAISTVTDLQTSLDSKQPLSSVLTDTTASFTTSYKALLDTVDSITLPGLISATNIIKLNTVSVGATSNSPDSTLLNRSNHIGYQSIASITGLTDALNAKQNLNAVLTGTTASFTTAYETKLNNIAVGATANDTDINLKARENHTGTQAISTVVGLQDALDGKQPTLESGVNIATINGSSILTGSNIVIDGDVILDGIQVLNGKSGEEVNLIPSDIGAATAAQGALADTAVQPSGMSSYVSGVLAEYPTDAELASAIATRATAAQGILANTALQPGAVETNSYVKRIRTLALAAQ